MRARLKALSRRPVESAAAWVALRGFGCSPSPLMTSYPLFSSDLIRVLAPVVWTGGNLECSTELAAVRGAVSIESKEIEGFIECLEYSDLSSRLPALLIHGGDAGLAPHQAAVLRQVFSRVWVSSLDPDMEDDVVRWMPIGLESISYGRSGCRSWYPPLETILSFAGSQIEHRENLMFGSFRLSTNSAVRPVAREVVAKRHAAWLEPRQKHLGDYFRQLSQSIFVLSPPGNGLDCHRTWEAIYHGAIPIVLRGTLPSHVVQELPILELDTFTDLLDFSDAELLEKSVDLNSRSRAASLAPTWIARLDLDPVESD